MRGGSIELPVSEQEHAIYAVNGGVRVDGTPIEVGQLAVLEPGTACTLSAAGDARAMLLGGAKFPTSRYIWWNFVASSRERIERAKERWERRQFPAIPGETELMPMS